MNEQIQCIAGHWYEAQPFGTCPICFEKKQGQIPEPTDLKVRYCQNCIGYLQPRWDCGECGGTGIAKPATGSPLPPSSGAGMSLGQVALSRFQEVMPLAFPRSPWNDLSSGIQDAWEASSQAIASHACKDRDEELTDLKGRKAMLGAVVDQKNAKIANLQSELDGNELTAKVQLAAKDAEIKSLRAVLDLAKEAIMDYEDRALARDVYNKISAVEAAIGRIAK